MKYIEGVTYTDVRGQEHQRKEVPTADIDTVTVRFTCPLCGEQKSHQVEHPIPQDDQYTCPSCDEQFYILPVTGRDGADTRDMTLPEQIDYQLLSIADIHAIEDEYPGDMAEMTTSVRTIVAGGSGVVLGALGVALQLTQTSQLLGAQLLFTVGTAILILGIIAGILSLSIGAGGSLINGYRVYQRSGADYSFTEFLRRAGNYYNRRPFIRN